jgi:hypothetical protein
VLRRDPRLPRDEGAAREHKELGEVAARYELINGPVDREVSAPWRLSGQRRAIWTR